MKRSSSRLILVMGQGYTRPMREGEKGFRKVKISLARPSGEKKLTVIAPPGILVGPADPVADTTKP
jgi:hypothetical protein